MTRQPAFCGLVLGPAKSADECAGALRSHGDRREESEDFFLNAHSAQ